MAQLLILRGNSGSGKTSTAQLLQKRLGEGTILISQDMVRRQMLRVNDKVGSVSTDLLETLVDFGMQNCRYVILEGILTKRKHGKMLKEIADRYSPDVLVYYFDISFEETLKRHQYKDVDFGEDEMEKWYLEKDFLEVEGERIITDEMTQEDVVKEMMNSINIIK
ncbi:hypothetical protein ERX27_05130 [Macrococcus brunensis]|uniref:Kinase n=1 Tax=Macrococcus brunensis TaxID=198483 RepID=A0A4R6BE27_9STAP|nr:kinase [Macrococcus brunensis]TDL98061.1 hypothetical protein ERX27_05130 [Macrococcus brunensis]